MSPLCPPPTTITSHSRRASSDDRRRQADAAEPGVDRTVGRHVGRAAACQPRRSRAKRSTLRAATSTSADGVLDRQRPLLALAPRREEHAAVVLEQPVGVALARVVRTGTRGSCAPGWARRRPHPWRRTRSRSRGCGTAAACGGRARPSPRGARRSAAYAAGVRTSSSTVFIAATVSGLPLNVPTWSYVPSTMTSSAPRCHRSRRTAARRRAPWRGRRCRARHRSARRCRPTRSTSPVFTSSNVSSAPCAWSRSTSAWRKPGGGGDDADVHHHRLDDHAGDLAGVREQDALRPRRDRRTARRRVDAAAISAPRCCFGNRAGPVGRPGVVGVRVDATPGPSRGGRGSCLRP